MKDLNLLENNQIKIAANGRRYSQPPSQKGLKRSTKTKEKLSLAHLGKVLSDGHKEKISLSLRGKKKSLMHVRRVALANLGKKRSKETKKKLSKRVGPLNSRYGKKLSPDTKKKISEGVLERYKDEEYVKRRLERWVESLKFQRRPTKLELELKKILEILFPEEYEYVGNFALWIGGKNPDFVNVNGKKKIIEAFGSYWHRERPGNLWEFLMDERVAHFKSYGFDTLVVWDKELKDKEKLIFKLQQFQGGQNGIQQHRRKTIF